MKKLLIFTSNAQNQADSLVDFFSGGNRIEVAGIFTDVISSEGGPRSEKTETTLFPAEEWRNNPSTIAQLVNAKEVDLVIIDGLRAAEENIGEWQALLKHGSVDSGHTLPHEGKIMIFNCDAEGQYHALIAEEEGLSDIIAPEPANSTFLPRAIVSLFDRELHPIAPPPPAQAATKKSIEDEWADTLNLTPNPPIIPDTQSALPPNPHISPFASDASLPPSAPSTPQPPMPPMPKTYLLWSVLAIIFCCFIPAIVALLYSSQVSSKYYAGDYAGSQRASQNAQIWIIISIVVGIVAATLYLPIMMLTA